MKTNAVAILVALVMSLPLGLTAQMLNVPTTIQEQDQWCWAGTSSAVLKYYGTNLAQCTIADYARTVATWHDFGTVNCCVNGSGQCNYWNYAWGTAGSIQDIFAHWGISSYGLGAAYTIAQTQTDLNAGIPFIIRWGWSTGGGHFVVGNGLRDSTLYFMNPWFGEGAEFADYSWVIYDGNHTWTHTVVITTPPDHAMAPPASLSATPGNGQITLKWTKNSEAAFLRYRIYGGTAVHPITVIDSTTGGRTDTVKTISGLTAGVTYHFRVVAADNSGNVSGFSNEVSAAPGACCSGTTGNVNQTGIVDLADLSSLVSYLIGGGYVLPCPGAANINATGIIDLADLSALVNYLTGGTYVLPACP
jgi:hypothetical protein